MHCKKIIIVNYISMDPENKFIKIQEYYDKINKNLDNMSEDIEKLDNTHKYYLKSAINDIQFHYSVYIDDIFFQKKILYIEYTCMNDIHRDNINKLYRDLYKLYNKIIKLLISIINENNKLILKINDIDNTKISTQNIDDLKKKYFTNIKVFYELKSVNEHFTLDDIKLLYDVIIKRNNDINENIKQIKTHITSIDKKIIKGIFIETFKISLLGTIESLSLENNLYIKIFNSILNNHLIIAQKYFYRTKNISDEVTFDEDLNSIASSDILDDDTENKYDQDHELKINNKKK
jgi:hypothetical protein